VISFYFVHVQITDFVSWLIIRLTGFTVPTCLTQHKITSSTSHADTVVPECYKNDIESQWKNLKFDPTSSENAWTDGYQNWQGWLRSRYLALCKLHYDPITGFCPPPHMQSCLSNVHLASFCRFFQLAAPRPLCRFWRLVRRKMSFRAKIVPFGFPKTKHYILTTFPRNRNLRLKTGFNMGTSSINTPKTTSYAAGSCIG